MRGKRRQKSNQVHLSIDNSLASEPRRLFEAGKITSAIESAQSLLAKERNPLERSRIEGILGMALFERGQATSALDHLRSALSTCTKGNGGNELEFSTTMALFTRESQFQSPAEVVSTLSRPRQLAALIGNPLSLTSLHLAVARLEAYRGHCFDARRHLEIARTAASMGNLEILRSAIDLVDASLESIAGNLRRATYSAKECFEQSALNGFGILRAGSVTNLGYFALTKRDVPRAKEYLAHALERTAELAFIRLAAIDNLLQVALYEDDLDQCDRYLKECATAIAQHDVPARSWYDFAHQVTRCNVLAHIGDWDTVLEITREIDPELERRQFRSLRTAILCASARAYAHLGEHERAAAKLSVAIRVCPRGAVDPLIVLEAATGTCMTLRGRLAEGGAHFDRALSAAKAIGNKLQEWHIERERTTCGRKAAPSAEVDDALAPQTISARGIVLSDAATLLGAGSSIDLLAHRAQALVQGTPLEPRLRVRSSSGEDFRPETSVTSYTTASGAFRIELRGSDRRVLLTFDTIDSLDDVTMIKSLLDLLQAAVHQKSDPETSAEEQNLWPTTVQPGNDDTVFRSPRMTEILRVAIRLAATELPILITGETGTGKDVFARLIHAHSHVKRGPYVPFNCSSIPRDLTESQLFGHRRGSFTGALETAPGVIRSASGGTLFLDEIGDLDYALQPKLLRFMESGEIHAVGDPRPTRVDVRIVAATNADLNAMAAEGRFRRDLLFRLGTAQIHLPPLRERKDEIPALTASFVNRFSHESERPGLKVSDDLIAALLLCNWPGNIRQLANELHRIVAMAEPGQTLTSADLSPAVMEGWTLAPTSASPKARSMNVNLDQPLPQAIEELERAFVDRAMLASGGRVAEAAQLLGISRKGLFLKRRRWGFLDDPVE